MKAFLLSLLVVLSLGNSNTFAQTLKWTAALPEPSFAYDYCYGHTGTSSSTPVVSDNLGNTAVVLQYQEQIPSGAGSESDGVVGHKLFWFSPAGRLRFSEAVSYTHLTLPTRG